MYVALKTVHIVSSTILFGTGIGIAFFMWMANRSESRQAVAVVTRLVVKADLYFTTPSIVIQPLSGFGLMAMSGYPMRFAPVNWLGLSLILYGVASACWLPVLWLQWRMQRLVSIHAAEPALPDLYSRYERAWTLLGVPAFCSLAVVFWLMVARPF